MSQYHAFLQNVQLTNYWKGKICDNTAISFLQHVSNCNYAINCSYVHTYVQSMAPSATHHRFHNGSLVCKYIIMKTIGRLLDLQVLKYERVATHAPEAFMHSLRATTLRYGLSTYRCECTYLRRCRTRCGMISISLPNA